MGAELGIVTKDIAIDWDALQVRRTAVPDSLSKGVSFLWDKGKITTTRRPRLPAADRSAAGAEREQPGWHLHLGRRAVSLG
jgi:hypothetical protein